MNLYRLNDAFVSQELVEGYKSLIWTERYNSPGDMQVTCVASKENLARFTVGTLFGADQTKEVMVVHTTEVKDNVLTVKGASLLDILRFRFWRNGSLQNTSVEGSKLSGSKPETAMTFIVNYACINNRSAIFGNFSQQIANLSTYVDPSVTGTVTGVYVLPFNDVYSIVKDIGDSASLGQTIEVVSATPSGYSLRYKVYKGADRSSQQTANPLIRFSQSLDSLQNVQELVSNAEGPNVVYVTTAKASSTRYGFWALPGALELPDFKRKTLVVKATDINPADYGGSTTDLDELKAALDVRALTEILQRNIVAFDGEMIPNGIYQVNRDFFLGDVVEMASASGITSRVRVSEVIRTKDDSGDRVYPTLSTQNV